MITLNWKAQTNGQGQSLTTTWLPVHSYSFEGLDTQRLRVCDHSDCKRYNPGLQEVEILFTSEVQSYVWPFYNYVGVMISYIIGLFHHDLSILSIINSLRYQGTDKHETNTISQIMSKLVSRTIFVYPSKFQTVPKMTVKFDLCHTAGVVWVMRYEKDLTYFTI